VGTELLEVGLDLLDALVLGCEGAIADALTPQLAGAAMELVGLAADSTSVEARQSAFGLLGDLATHAWPVLLPYAPGFARRATRCLSVITGKNRPAANNAIWALGCMASNLGHEAWPVISPALPYLCGALTAKVANDTMLGNSACVVGRLAMLNPAAVADAERPPLTSWYPAWARACTLCSEPAERLDAFRGLAAVAVARPGAVAQCLAVLGVAFAHVDFKATPSVELHAEIKGALAAFKAGLPPPQWAAVWGGWNDITRKQLGALGATA
jgi:transportin-1